MKRFSIGVMGAGLIASMLAGPAMAAAPGEEVVVTAGSAPLMIGWSTLGNVFSGQRLRVIEVRGNWVGTSINANGRRIAGWVWNGQVATPQQLAARRTMRRSYSFAPGTMAGGPVYYGNTPMAGDAWRGPYPYATNTLPPDMRDYVTGGMRSGSPLIIGATKYGPNYWRADRKIIGY